MGIEQATRDSARPPVLACSLIEKLLKRLGYEPGRLAVFEVWDRMMGQEARRFRAVGIKRDRLCVEVDSSAHMHELLLRRRNLMRKMSEYFGGKTPVRDIVPQLASARAKETRIGA